MARIYKPVGASSNKKAVPATETKKSKPAENPSEKKNDGGE